MTVFAAIDHCTAECVGIHAVRRVTRFEALEPLRQGVREHLGAFGSKAAAGLRIRHDHGSQSRSDHFQNELRFLGMDSSPAFVREPECKVNDDRLYRALDRLLPHKKALEQHLKQRLGELFDLDYDLLLYDVTSTYFEVAAEGNELAQRGQSRDHRPDCEQVNIALVVSRCGMPLGYEVFAGNRADVTTVEEVVERVESLYGKAHRIRGMDRGMVSEENVEFRKKGGRRYIAGTPKGRLRRFEQELSAKEWKQVHAGLGGRLCPAPAGQEVFILCRSAQRREKERGLHDRFEKRIEVGLTMIAAACQREPQMVGVIERRIGQPRGAAHGWPGCSATASRQAQMGTRGLSGQGDVGREVLEGLDRLEARVVFALLRLGVGEPELNGWVEGRGFKEDGVRKEMEFVVQDPLDF